MTSNTDDQWVLRWENGEEARLPLGEVIELLRASPGRTSWTGRTERDVPLLAAPSGTRTLLPIAQIPALRSEWIAAQERGIGAQKYVSMVLATLASVATGIEFLMARSASITLLAVLSMLFWMQVLRDHRRQRRFSADLASAEAVPQALRKLQARWHIKSLGPDSRSWWLVAAMGMVALMQLWLDQSGPAGYDTIERAGLLKPLPEGEPWRLWTAPLLHGGLIHLLVNCVALISFARVIDSLCVRWWTPLVWMLGALGGTLASVTGSNSASIGASGGILAMAGFLLILGVRLRPVLPWLLPSMMQTLLCVLLLSALLPHAIDHFAHAGGLVVGILLGLLYPLSARLQDGPPTSRPATFESRATGWLVDVLFGVQWVWTVLMLT